MHGSGGGVPLLCRPYLRSSLRHSARMSAGAWSGLTLECTAAQLHREQNMVSGLAALSTFQPVTTSASVTKATPYGAIALLMRFEASLARSKQHFAPACHACCAAQLVPRWKLHGLSGSEALIAKSKSEALCVRPV